MNPRIGNSVRSPSSPGGEIAAPVIDSRQLFAPGQNTVLIEHQGLRYTLRLTRENKLILTK